MLKRKKSYTCYKAFRVGIFIVITFAQYKTRKKLRKLRMNSSFLKICKVMLHGFNRILWILVSKLAMAC